MKLKQDVTTPARLTVDLCSVRRKKLRLLASVHNVSMAEMMRLMTDHYFTEMTSQGKAGIMNFFNQDVGK